MEEGKEDCSVRLHWGEGGSGHAEAGASPVRGGQRCEEKCFLPKSAVQSAQLEVLPFTQGNGLTFLRARKKSIRLRMDWVLEAGVEHSEWVSKEN